MTFKNGISLLGFSQSLHTRKWTGNVRSGVRRGPKQLSANRRHRTQRLSSRTQSIRHRARFRPYVRITPSRGPHLTDCIQSLGWRPVQHAPGPSTHHHYNGTW